MADFSKPLDIVVIGGSLAGLFTSIPLLRLPVKHRITILERSPTPLLHDQGAGIVAGSETLAWFQKHDSSPRHGELGNISVLSRERFYLDRDGGVIDREESHQRMTSWDLVYHLTRWGFDRTWSEYIGVEKIAEGEDGKGETEKRAVYAYGCTVQDVREVDGKVVVKYQKAVPGEDGAQEGTIEADFLIAADGPSSSMRKTLLGLEAAGKRKYAGYVAFRGTVPEVEISDAAKDVFVQRFTFFHGHEPNTQILAYTIPGPEGSLDEGKRLVNWVWYWNLEDDSKEYIELMTDSDGKNHRFTLPTGGKMQKHVWERQLRIAKEQLPPQFAEIISKTVKPFVQAVTDLEPPSPTTQVGRLLNGRAVLVGDALAGFRPHTAASTGQAALHALLLEKVFSGEMDWAEYEQRVMKHAWSWQQRGVMLGQRSQFGRHPLAVQSQQRGETGTGTGQEEVGRNELWMREK